MGNRQNIYSSLPSSKQDLILKHLSLLLETNESLNLTRIASPEEAKVLHIEDSLAALPELLASPEGLYGDLGSGNGYPGIPLAIASGRQTILVESVKKKAAALEHFVAELGLFSQIQVVGERIEEAAWDRRTQFAVLTARALTALPSLLELASPLLQTNGHLICFKSQLPNEELDTARSIETKMGFTLLSDDKYVLSDSRTERRMIVFQKTGDTTVLLPRRVGMAQKKPYTH